MGGEAKLFPQADRAPKVGVVIVAAGQSRRMEGRDKVFTPLMGLPLIVHSVEVFEKHPGVHQVVLVLSQHSQEAGSHLAQTRGWHKVSLCAGGPRRQDSVRLGLERLAPCDWVMVHDGARPCLDAPVVDRGLEAARDTGAAVAAVPAKDTIKQVASTGLVEATPPRETLWLAQTPQVFRYNLLRDAHRTCQGDFTDDAAMAEMLGHRVKVFMGSYANLKVTTPQDLLVAEAFLRSAQDGRPWV